MRAHINGLLRYVVTGGAAAVVDLGGFLILTSQNVAVAPAAIISFVAAAVVNYMLTSRFVFASKASLRRFVLFFAVALVGLAVNVGVTVLAATVLRLPPGFAKVIGIGTAFLLNFALNAGVVFRGTKGSRS